MSATETAKRPGEGFQFPATREGYFDPTAWLSALTAIGGTYALTADRRLIFLADECDRDQLANVMAYVAGHSERQETVKRTIEARQNGELSA